MIPKKNRLTAKKDFTRVFAKGRLFRSRGISMKIVRNGLQESRFGFVISKKVTKKAVARNKIRRRLRTSVGRRLENIVPGHDVAVLVFREVLDLGFKETDASVERLLMKSGLMKKR
ncbi:MAG: ribonuclease P protein component [Patescibacteria group bacterium]|nr:ribonuclease P protein component [Patescibacteria group bacterium]